MSDHRWVAVNQVEMPAGNIDQHALGEPPEQQA